MRWLNGQTGLSMLEVMLALALLGLAGVALIVSLNGAFRAQDISREQVRAENLARSQLEYIREEPYEASGAYTVPPPGVLVPQGYEITIATTLYCDGAGDGYEVEGCYDPANIQRNTVRVSREGKGLVTVEDLKTRRQ